VKRDQHTQMQWSKRRDSAWAAIGGIEMLLPPVGEVSRPATSQATDRAAILWALAADSGEGELRSSQGHFTGRAGAGAWAGFDPWAGWLQQHEWHAEPFFVPAR
jgi:hypothetical protein